MKKFIFASTLIAFIALPQIWGRVWPTGEVRSPISKTALIIAPLEAKRLIAEKKTFILDVHTPEQTHIPGTDAFIPFDQIEKNLSKLPVDKNSPILVYCQSGNMSKTASEQLVKLGYSKVYDLEGGTNAFKEVSAEVVLSPVENDFGQVVYGDVATTRFVLTNYSPAPLKIVRVSTSCGCTKAEVDKKEISPYGAVTVRVTFDPAIHKDDTDLGELTRSIYIETDNPNFPKLTSVIKAVVTKKSSP